MALRTRHFWLLGACAVAPAGAACETSAVSDAGFADFPDGASDARLPEGDASADAPSAPDAMNRLPGAPSDVVAEAVVVASKVTTMAGSGTDAYADGTGAGASFSFPSAVAVDASGNVFVTDRNSHHLRKVTPAGVVTTAAGSGLGTFADGTGAQASFLFPSGIAIDGAGNLYVADKYNHRIRKVTPAGLVTTLAGSDTAAWADGTGPGASFTSPAGIAVDLAGNLYVADVSTETVENNRIRKVSPGGVVTTIAGGDAPAFADGTGAAARFNNPIGVAVDAAGIVYVADERNHRIRKITPAGQVTTLAGSGTGQLVDGTGAAASFYNPVGIAVDAAGNLYVGDFYNDRIRRVTIAGVVTTLAGSQGTTYADGSGLAAGFNYPYGVAVDAARNVYVGDYYNHRVRKIATEGIGQLTVAWKASTSTGTSPVTGYSASAAAAGHAPQACTAMGATSCTIAGLASGVAYSISVTATNAAGASAPSPARAATPN